MTISEADNALAVIRAATLFYSVLWCMAVAKNVFDAFIEIYNSPASAGGGE